VLRVGEASLQIAGIDDAGFDLCAELNILESSYRTQTEFLHALIEEGPEADTRLLLVHNPEYTRLLPGGSMDLVLAGHTHGGYVNLPMLRASLPARCSQFAPVAGLIQIDHTHLYVNRGLGGIGLRFNARPEITVLSLVSR
jgi:predicted MPP superfamily phosphohydrolase